MAVSVIAIPFTTAARRSGGSTVAPRWRDPVPLRLTRSGRAVVLEPAAGRFRWSADGRRQGSAAGATGGRVPPTPAPVLEPLRRAVKSSRADGAGPLTARRRCRGLRASARAHPGSDGSSLSVLLTVVVRRHEVDGRADVRQRFPGGGYRQ